MKRFVTLLIFSLLIYGCGSSVSIPSPDKETKSISAIEKQKIQEAIKYHDEGDFDKAITIYQDILNSNPDNVKALYEISFSLSMKKEYQRSLDYVFKGFEYNSNLLNEFYVIAGNDLDDLGKTKEAISVYKKGLKKFPSEYLLYYNLAISYGKLNEAKETEESLINCIKLNQKHPSSHFVLASLYKSQGKQIPSLLLFLRFLTLEPNTSRSQLAIASIDELLNWGVDKKDANNININVSNFGKSDSPYSMIELMLRMERAESLSEENQNKSPMELKLKEISSLVSMIVEHNKDKSSDFTLDYLSPYFKKMEESNNIVAFTNYIYQSDKNDEINTWLSKNPDWINEFLKWNNEFKWNFD